MDAKVPLTQILFLDIETVPQVPRYSELEEPWQLLWSDKTRFIQQRDGITASEAYEKAGIYAEFGKVVCISTAFFFEVGGGLKLRVKSFYGDNENQLLTEFAALLRKHYNTPDKCFCGHNLKEFDLPFLARRMVVHQIPLPSIMDVAGMKPWNVKHLDTMELWKFGDHKHYTSLALLTCLLGVPTPKDDMAGADVARVYWEEHNLQRIRSYCEKDTVAVAQLLLRFRYLPLLSDESIEVV
jgi:predicted PolB exonuclease-like 3'-5' exonuclease